MPCTTNIFCLGIITRQWQSEDVSGYYQMGHGAVSMLAYANWHNDKKIAEYTFKTTFQNINYKIWDEEGFIDNNSFRGVRGYWYHSLALNNMLGVA